MSARKRKRPAPKALSSDAIEAVREALIGKRGIPGVVWYARGDNITRCGPFPSAFCAKESMRMIPIFEGRERLPEHFMIWPEPEEVDRDRE